MGNACSRCTLADFFYKFADVYPRVGKFAAFVVSDTFGAGVAGW